MDTEKAERYVNIINTARPVFEGTFKTEWPYHLTRKLLIFAINEAFKCDPRINGLHNCFAYHGRELAIMFLRHKVAESDIDQVIQYVREEDDISARTALMAAIKKANPAFHI